MDDLTPEQELEYKQYLASQSVWQSCVCCGKNKIVLETAQLFKRHSMNQIDFLKFTATILCLITGILASFAALSFELDTTPKILINFISLSCLPLGLYMAYDTVISSKS